MVEIQKRYDALFQNMAQGVFFQEKSGALIDVNPAALEMFGLTRSQFLGRTSLHPDWKVIKEDGSDLLPEQHPSMVALKTGKEIKNFVAGVYNPLRKGIIWLNINATPMFLDGEEKPYQTFVTLHDITPQMQTKNLYQSRLNLLDFTQSHTLDELLVFTLDEVEKLTDSMIGFYHFYDADTQEITLNTWSSQTSKQFCQVTSEEGHYPLEKAGVWVDCIREDRPVIHNDYQSLKHRKGLPEGHAQIVRELVVPVKRKGKVVAILGVGNKPRDYTEADIDTVMLFADMAWGIAEKKRSEGLLRQSESRYRALTETSMDGYWVVDGSSRQIVAVNDSMTQIYGYGRDEFLAKTLLDLEVSEDELLAKEHIEKIKAKGSDHFESKHRLKGGQIIDVEVGVTYLPESDNLLCFVRDISHRKKAEEELRNSEQLFRALFEQAGGYCMILDPNTTDGIPVIVDANEAACEMHGYTREEFIGRPVADIDDEEGKRLVKQRTAEIMTGKPFYVENVHVRKDGTKFDVAVNAKRIDIGTSPPLILSTEYDITEKKRVKEQSLKQQYYLEKAQELGRIGTWELDIINNILVWTDENCRIFGVPPGSIVNYEVFFEKVHPEDRQYVNQEWSAALEGKNYDIEHRIEVAGEIRWVREKADITFDSSGTAVSAIGFTQDITERKLAEEELVKSQQLLEKMGQVSKVGGWEFNIDTGYLQWTEEIYHIHEVGLDYVPTVEKALDFYSETSKPVISEAVQRAIDHGEPFDLELEIITANSNLQSVHTLGMVDLELRRVYGVIQDITERKKTENDLHRHKESLDELVAERTEQLNRTLKLMTGRELRMAELKRSMDKLKAQLLEAGIKPEIDDNYEDPSTK